MEATNSVKKYEVERAWKQTRIAGQENKDVQEQIRIRNRRVYLQRMNVAKKVLTRYISPIKKPIRFLKPLADKLFERRTKHSVTAYHEFLSGKIRELQRRNMRFCKYQALRSPLTR